MAIVYREMGAAEIGRLGEIDRSEWIDGRYVLVDGCLTVEAGVREHPGFSAEAVAAWVVRLRGLPAGRGAVYGAFDGARLVGISAVHGQRRGVRGDRQRLEFLHVSRPYRGQGIGRQLLALAVAAARRSGARQLYITASPSRPTVDFYLHMGCRPAREIDAELFAEEPYDIHLELDVRSQGSA